jgi:YD repeat-containing protein
MKMKIKRFTALFLSIILTLSLLVVVSASTVFIYDDMGRLTEIHRANGDRTIFTYDQAGNMIHVSVITVNAVEIHTAQDLNNIRNNPSGNFRLMNDIDMTGINWVPIGTRNAPFTGVLDGDGFVISNLTINLPSQNYVGLFGFNSGTIMALGLSDVNIIGLNNIGAIAGNNTANIMDSYVSGEVRGNNNVGGVVGQNSGGILKSYSTSNAHGNNNIGGFVGLGAGGNIDQCYAAGNVHGNSNVGGFAGELTGNNSVIINAFATGRVLGSSNTAGFVGNIASGRIENSYSVSNNANGFRGNTGGTIVSSYFDREIIGTAITSSEARTTAQMMSRNNFINWDFDNIWYIDEGISYPTLRALTGPTSGNPHINEDIAWLTFDRIRGENEFENSIRTNLNLPTLSLNNALITWESNEPTVISGAGIVSRPSYGENAVTVTLTATFRHAFETGQRVFTLTVEPQDPRDAQQPTINSQPSDVTVVTDQAAMLSVNASVSVGQLSYQWYEHTPYGDILLNGETASTINAPTNAAGARIYYVVITNTDTSATRHETASVISNNATVTVNPRDAGQPVIIGNPASVTVFINGAATLSVNATVTVGQLSYQWYEYVSGVSTLLDGETGSTFNAPTNAAGARIYYVVVTNTDATATGTGTATATSNRATVTVNPRNAAMPTIISHPANVTIFTDAAATLSVNASVSLGQLSYQWYEFVSGASILLDGETASTFNSQTNIAGARTYYVVITNADTTATGAETAAATSNRATVTVNARQNAAAPVITGYSNDFVIPVGGTAVLAVTAGVSRGVLTYQWYERIENDDIPILGANQPAFSAPTNIISQRNYFVVVTNTDTLASGLQTATTIGDIITVNVSADSLFHNVAFNVDGVHRFANRTVGYDNTENLLVSVTNSGLNNALGLSVIISGGDVDAFNITPLGQTSLIVNGATSFTLSPNMGLLPNDYMAIVSVVGDNNILVSFVAIFTVIDDTPTQHTITVTSGANGRISPYGSVAVTVGINQAFVIIPNSGYFVSDVLIDGVSIGAVTSHTFVNVTADHSIHATFAANNNNAGGGGSSSTSRATILRPATTQPRDENDERGIIVNGQTITTQADEDGVFRFVFTDITSTVYGEVEIVLIESDDEVFVYIPISLLGTNDLIVKGINAQQLSMGSIRLPNRTVANLGQRYGDTLTLSLNQGSGFVLRFE